MNTPSFVKPFGPVIYSNTLDDNILQLLRDCRETSEYVAENVGYLLAGALEKQLNLIRTAEQEEKILAHIYEHVAAYVNGDPTVVKDKFLLCDDTIWLNIQQAGEFNPTHHHKGDISGVIYLDIPNEILEEQAAGKAKGKSFFDRHGQISFYYGEDLSCPTYHHVMPSVGQILLFPAKLKHSVHPFYSDVERISVAFNFVKQLDTKIVVDAKNL
jgi:uncharacterized protein (TIGR02466 family)